jgi:low temperature requirement protein LtrA
MSPRDPEQEHRAATPLELFFDLTFVAAVALAGAGLEHGLATGHPAQALAAYPIVFFAIWWAWMNFTWFASAYDTDDAPYRIAVLIQMTGALIVAAGISRAFRGGWHLEIITAGYVVMRLALVALWLRAAAADPGGRRGAVRYAAGVTALQVLWVARLALPSEGGLASFLVLAALELAVPVWAEAAGRTSWHPRHIAERYALFTIIVLGEAVLAATTGVQKAVTGSVAFGAIATTVTGGLLIVFSMWWLYFDLPAEEVVTDVRRRFATRLSGAFLWGYGHYVVFGCAAAVGAGLAVSVGRAGGDARLGSLAAGFAVTAPVAGYLLTVWVLHAPYKRHGAMRAVLPPAGVALILASSATGEPVLATGLILALLVAAGVAFGTPAADAQAGH